MRPLAAEADLLVHLEELRLILFLQVIVNLLEVVDDLVDAFGLQGELFVKNPKVYVVAGYLLLLGVDAREDVEVVDELAVYSLQPRQELLHAFEVLEYQVDFILIVSHSFKVLLVIVHFSR
jgi:hypothetical protein